MRVRPAEILANIQHVSCLGLPSEAAIPAMLQLFDTLVDSRNSNFVWTDRAGRPTNIYARFLVPAALDVMLHHSQLLYRPGEISFEMHTTSTLAAGNMERFKATTNYEKTIAYNEIWKPHAVDQFSDIILRDRTGPRGLVMIGRAANDTGFTVQEEQRVQALRPWLLHALDTPPAAELSSVETGEEAVLLCDYRGAVIQMGPNAAKLLLYAGNGRIAPGAVIAGLGDAMPETVRRVCQNLAAIMSGRPADVPQARLKTSWGTFNFRAHALGTGLPGKGPEGLLAVVIRREQPFALMLHNRVAHMPLTPRQRQVAVMIGLGRSPETIQRELELSAGTYRRHVEEIHGRLGVHSRAELMAALMTREPTSN